MMDTGQILQEMMIKLDNLNTKVDIIQTDVGVLKTDVSDLKTDVKELQTSVNKLQISNEAIMSQTALLTEFRTEINEKYDHVIDDFEFLKHKAYQNEKDVYKLNNIVRTAKLAG